jgi:hypothetical protein
MRIEAEPFDYSVPTWRPYDADRLRALGAPEAAVASLTGRGLPDDIGRFVRAPERELAEADLPECGKAAFLGQVWDGFNNTYWLSLRDGSVWMRYGGEDDEPIDQMKRVNTSVEALQSILAVLEAYTRATPRGISVDAREDVINQTVIHAVAADPEVFEDGENWWSVTLQEIQGTSAQVLLGDRSLFRLVNRDESGRWGLDHPGFEYDPTLQR